jgi:hypothetical protein
VYRQGRGRSRKGGGCAGLSPGGSGMGRSLDSGGRRRHWSHSLDILVDGSWIRPRVEVLPWRWRSCFRQRRRKEQAPSPDLVRVSSSSYLADSMFASYARLLHVHVFFLVCSPDASCTHAWIRFWLTSGGLVWLCGQANPI